jgi:hypothetical protein
VQGVCADCWGVKDPDVAIDLRPPSRTEPLLGFGDLDDFLGVGAVVAVPVFLGIVVAVLFLVFR